MNISPKTRFQQNPSDVKQLASLIKEDWFHRALEFATLQYQQRLLVNHDASMTVANFNCLLGADGFKKELLSLHESFIERAAKPIGNLNHQA